MSSTTEIQLGNLRPAQRIVYALFMLTVATGLIWFALWRAESYEQLAQRAPAVDVAGRDILIPIGGFGAFGLALICLLGLWGSKAIGVAQKILKGMSFTTIAALIAWPLCSFGLVQYLHAQHYSECSELSSVSIWTASVWVSDPAFCIERSNLARHEILEWLNNEFASGSELAPAYVVPNLIRIRDQEHARLRKLRER